MFEAKTGLVQVKHWDYQETLISVWIVKHWDFRVFYPRFSGKGRYQQLFATYLGDGFHHNHLQGLLWNLFRNDLGRHPILQKVPVRSWKWGKPQIGGTSVMDGLVHGKSYYAGWFRGTPHFRKPPSELYFSTYSKFLKLPTGADIGLELRDCWNFHSFLSDLKHMPRHLALWGSTQKDPEIETQWACCSEETF